tara:strand:+ start:433 stop:1011 length:579 start_codon:yes stop_codon:yes gene_type:complete
MPNKTLTIDGKIEAILFFKGEPVKKQKLADILECTSEEINMGIQKLTEALSSRGLQLIIKEETVELRTTSVASSLIEKIIKDDISKDLGKAGTETLAIVLYKGPVAKREIDYIRGVNSSFILRNLMIRGLVERTTNKQDARSFVYKPTSELLAHLGISSVEELPEYNEMITEIRSFEEAQKEHDHESTDEKN